eukprot:CAMPEP_0113500446 /NCGR_PEP_ID=MMETSP0014_2-20120614/32334_1 /TAXON_ID=2857 /ORGANISM="Nitzschia sp." /LENGTH=365 /DNA_ID=CAMNT_0000394785 /DNA_START=129 /DNA_END=1226 /DNA_ORIENTATION=- /assembly_acc=CAM_ASM_000159
MLKRLLLVAVVSSSLLLVSICSSSPSPATKGTSSSRGVYAAAFVPKMYHPHRHPKTHQQLNQRLTRLNNNNNNNSKNDAIATVPFQSQPQQQVLLVRGGGSEQELEEELVITEDSSTDDALDDTVDNDDGTGGGGGGGAVHPTTMTATTTTKTTTAGAGVVVSGAASLVSKMSCVLSKTGLFYSKSLEARPIMTKSMTAGLIFGLSDYLAQLIEQQRNDAEKTTPVAKFDWTRLVASALIGLLYFGPAAHYWYEWIFKLFPATTLQSTMVKAFWGQVLFGPSFTCIFFASALLQSGDFSIKKWFTKIKTDLPGAWLAGTGYWPIVDLISYSVVPVKLIPLFINMASLIWTIYLSIIANKKQQQQK